MLPENYHDIDIILSRQLSAATNFLLLLDNRYLHSRIAQRKTNRPFSYYFLSFCTISRRLVFPFQILQSIYMYIIMSTCANEVQSEMF